MPRPRPPIIPVRNPSHELKILLEPSPTFNPQNPPLSQTWLDEAGFIEQSMGRFVSADRTLARTDLTKEEVEKEEDEENMRFEDVDDEDDSELVEVPKKKVGKKTDIGSDNKHQAAREVSPAPSNSSWSSGSSMTGSFASAFSSFTGSKQRNGSVSSDRSKTSETEASATGEPLHVVEDYWEAPVEQSSRRLTPGAFMPPPKGKSEFDEV